MRVSPTLILYNIYLSRMATADLVSLEVVENSWTWRLEDLETWGAGDLLPFFKPCAEKMSARWSSD